jgi:hypothetical protein
MWKTLRKVDGIKNSTYIGVRRSKKFLWYWNAISKKIDLNRKRKPWEVI